MMPKKRSPEDKLERYLVGGAVRDRVMGRAVADRDWVVVGSTPEQMAELGFRPVGRDFPVFLHPHTHEEYALARTERKTTRGYHGFEFFSDPYITLQQDLARRDLTMNAMAMDHEGNLIDPYNGEKDIQRKIIRHVSDAFSEDPVRLLRVARFAARFTDFSVCSDTRRLMTEMADNGEADTLAAERVWQEMNRAMQEEKFSRFLTELKECGALRRLLPEVDALFGVPQTAKYHPEIDTGIHTLMSVDAAGAMTRDPMIIFAVMVHDLGKALTPHAELPRHKGHEKRGLKSVASLCNRLGVPARFREFALKVCEYHLHCHRIRQLKPDTVLKVLEAFGGFRKPDLVEKFASCCCADRRGRSGHENDECEETALLLQMHRAALQVEQGQIARQLLDECGEGRRAGLRIKKAVCDRRIAAIARVKKSIPDNHTSIADKKSSG